MKYSTFFRDSTHILLTRDFISMMKEVPLYHQMNGGIHMNQLVTGKFIALKRKQKNLTQEQLAEKLGVSNKTMVGILHHEEGVDLVPANLELSAMEFNLVNAMSRETTLKNYLSQVKNRYDSCGGSNWIEMV